MKHAAVFALALLSLGIPVETAHADTPSTRRYSIEWDHWLWLLRIAHGDPDYLPEDYDPADRRYPLYERKTAKQIYEACGIEMEDGEAVIYGSPPGSSAMIRPFLGRVFVKRLSQNFSWVGAWEGAKRAS